MFKQNLFEQDVDPTKTLTDLATEYPEKCVITKNHKNQTVYKTTFGCSFTNCSFGPTMWGYNYDDNLSSVSEYDKEGTLSGSDIIKVIKQLNINPNKLREIPEPIIYLGKLLKVNPKRKTNAFGKWHLHTGEISLFNNPFSLSLGYTNGPNDFEIWFIKKEEEPRGYQSIVDIENALNEYGYI